MITDGVRDSIIRDATDPNTPAQEPRVHQQFVRWEEEDVDIEAAADAFGAQRPTPEEMVEFRKRFESQHRFEMPASGTYLPHTSQPKSL